MDDCLAKGLDFYSGGTKYSIYGPCYIFDENFPVEKIVSIMQQFAGGQSSNILTITVASPDTYTHAVNSPEQYNLLRVRTGGWSNFFTSVFPLTQDQRRRRPVSAPVAVQKEDNAVKAVLSIIKW